MGVGQGSKVVNSGVDTEGGRGISFLTCRFYYPSSILLLASLLKSFCFFCYRIDEKGEGDFMFT